VTTGPLDIKYIKSQTSYWSGQERSVKPACIIIPTSTEDVSTVVSVLKVGYDLQIEDCKLAVRGAGYVSRKDHMDAGS
jgi:hypothetical protein